MTKKELLNYLEEAAKIFRLDKDHYVRNSHMHQIKESPSQEVIDAVLAGFINYIGVEQGVDYGLYSKYLSCARREDRGRHGGG